MARVPCEVWEDENDDGQECIRARCENCGHETESAGTSDRSVRRCLALMREGCPEKEENFYVEAED